MAALGRVELINKLTAMAVIRGNSAGPNSVFSLLFPVYTCISRTVVTITCKRPATREAAEGALSLPLLQDARRD
jgi:hypothetical protein